MSRLLHLHVCAECERESPALDKLKQAVSAALPGQVDVLEAPCLDLCPPSATPRSGLDPEPLPMTALTLQRKGGAGYAFSNIDLQTDTDDIVATCRAYLESPEGWIEDARPCGRLRFCLAARLPA